MSGQDTQQNAELEDVMMTDASTSTRVEATRVRQAERIIGELGDSGTTKPQQFEWLWSTQTRSIRRPGALGPETRTRHRNADWQSGGTRDTARDLRNRCGTPGGGNCRNCKGRCRLYCFETQGRESSQRLGSGRLWQFACGSASEKTTPTSRFDLLIFCNTVIAALQACMKLAVTSRSVCDTFPVR